MQFVNDNLVPVATGQIISAIEVTNGIRIATIGLERFDEPERHEHGRHIPKYRFIQ
jgi:hypothetical protein